MLTKKWIGCAPTNFRKGRPSGFVPTAIVVHVMDGTLTGTDAWFLDAAATVSAHYGVGRNGELHQYVHEEDTAFHAGTVFNPTWKGLRSGVNPNFYTVGIEHEGTAESAWPWDAAQLDTSAALIAEVAARWKIPLDLDHVIPHHAIRASKSCPGKSVLISEILERIPAAGGQSALPVPSITQLKMLKNVNLRFGEPSTSARIVRILPADTEWTIAGYTDAGERVQGNSIWYQDKDGNYVWAGATDVPSPV